MADVYYPGIAAGDAASITADGSVEAIVTPNANYEVFELDDTLFTTPLIIKTPGGLSDTKVPVGALPIFPDVYVVSPNFAHNWKSGDLVFRRDSQDAKDKLVADAVAILQRASADTAAAARAAEESSQFAKGPTQAQVDEAVRLAVRPSNLALAADGVPYISPGANDTSVYQAENGNYYFNNF